MVPILRTWKLLDPQRLVHFGAMLNMSSGTLEQNKVQLRSNWCHGAAGHTDTLDEYDSHRGVCIWHFSGTFNWQVLRKK